MPPPGPRHSSVVAGLARWFLDRVGTAATVRIHNPIQLDHRHLFLPDLALLRPDAEGYRTRYPGLCDTLLAVEVADSTRERDLGLELPVYERCGVEPLWVLYLAGGAVQAFASPAIAGYATTRSCRVDERLLLSQDGVVSARELLQT
jgi:hypothetical protein